LVIIRADKKNEGSVEVANPNLGCSGVKIHSAFFVDLGGCVRRRKDFDADFGRASENGRVLLVLWVLAAEPGNIGRFDAIGSRNRAFGERDALWQQALEERGYAGLATGVTRSGRWTHDNMSMPIRFNPIREFSKAWIGQDFGPPNEVKLSLRLEVWKFDGDGHGGKVRKKIENARIEPCAIFALLIATEMENGVAPILG
jgi:hypothetical protein